MRFKKDFIVYEKGDIKIFINQVHNPKRKTKAFAIRKNDKTGLSIYLGEIRFDGAWRQYVFLPDAYTKWSAGCKIKIAEFEERLNKEFREKHKNVKRN